MTTASTPCPLCGNIRRVLEADRYATTYRCGWCRTVSREEVEPDVRLDLQREWDR